MPPVLPPRRYAATPFEHRSNLLLDALDAPLVIMDQLQAPSCSPVPVRCDGRNTDLAIAGLLPHPHKERKAPEIVEGEGAKC